MAEPATPHLRSERTDFRVMRGPPPLSATMVVFALCVAALYFGREIFLPLALAILLSFVLAPLVRLLRHAHCPRVPAVVVAVVVAFLAISGIGTLIGGQVAQLAGNASEYQATIRDKLHSLRGAVESFGMIGQASSLIKDLRTEIVRTPEDGNGAPASAPVAAADQPPKPIPVEIRQAPLEPLELIKSLLGPLLEPLAATGIVILFLFFILLQREDLRDRFIRLVGARDLHRTTQALDDGVQRLSRYFIIQSIINTTFGVVIGTGLFFIGVPNPVLWGIVAGLLRFLPYIGAPIAAIFPAALAMAVDPGWSMLFWTLGLFAVVEPLVGQLLEPLLYGHSTGLSPVAVVVSAAFWTLLWGPAGLLLSTPLTVCLVVLGRHVDHLQFLDVLLGDRPALTPEESFYQRILAGDPDEAARQAEAFLKTKSLSAYYDEVAIKALALAQFDAERGVLDHERRVAIKDAIDGVIDDLSDHDDLAAERPEPHRELHLPPVLCVAGRGSLDEAAAAMLAQLLEKHGRGSLVVPSRAVSPANILRFDLAKVDTICLSFVEPGEFTRAHFLARRLRRRFPQAAILLGAWTLEEGDPAWRDVIERTGVDVVVTSLGAAVATIVGAETNLGEGVDDVRSPSTPIRAIPTVE